MDTMAPAARDEMMTARSCSAAQPHRSSSRTPTYLAGGRREGREGGGGECARKGKGNARGEGRGRAAPPTHSWSAAFARRTATAVSTACISCSHKEHGAEWGRGEPPPLSLPISPVIVNQPQPHLHGRDDGGGARHGEHRVARDAQLALRLVRLDGAEEDLAQGRGLQAVSAALGTLASLPPHLRGARLQHAVAQGEGDDVAAVGRARARLGADDEPEDAGSTPQHVGPVVDGAHDEDDVVDELHGACAEGGRGVQWEQQRERERGRRAAP